MIMRSKPVVSDSEMNQAQVQHQFENDPLTHMIIGAAIEVRRLLGPGLLDQPMKNASVTN